MQVGGASLTDQVVKYRVSRKMSDSLLQQHDVTASGRLYDQYYNPDVDTQTEAFRGRPYVT